MTELKQIDFSQNSFEASGVTYHVQTSLSVERYRQFEKLQLEFGYGISFKEVFDMHKKAVELANKGKGLEAWNIIFNLMEKVGKEFNRSVHPAMLICSLFLTEKDEDLTKWDEKHAEQKIKNWNDEGYDVNNFFRLASNLVTGYIETLEEVFRNTSEAEAKVRNMVGSMQNGSK